MKKEDKKIGSETLDMSEMHEAPSNRKQPIKTVLLEKSQFNCEMQNGKKDNSILYRSNSILDFKEPNQGFEGETFYCSCYEN